MREEVEGWLKKWFAVKGKLGKQAAQPAVDVDYFEAGWLTSMEVVEFVMEIEQRFGIQFSDRDLQDPRFVTIAGLTELILESTQARQGR